MEFSRMNDLTRSKLTDFTTAFYKESDTIPKSVIDESLDDDYLNFFEESITLKMGLNTFKFNEIKQMRINGWKNFKSRHHTVSKIAQFNDTEFLLLGNVDYVLKNDKPCSVQWSGHMKFNKSLTKLVFYQVYIDMANVIKLL